MPWSSIVLLLFAVLGVIIIKDRGSVIFAVLQGAMSVRSRKVSVSKRMKKFKTLGDTRISSLHLKESDIEISISGRKSVRSDCYPTIFDPTKSTNTASSRSKRLANRKAQCDEQPQAKKVCPRKLHEDSNDTCVDFSADAISVNHDHSYLCSQEQATLKSNPNGSDTTLARGKCSTTCQTDLTADEIDYLVTDLEECRREEIVAYIWEGDFWKYREVPTPVRFQYGCRVWQNTLVCGK